MQIHNASYTHQHWIPWTESSRATDGEQIYNKQILLMKWNENTRHEMSL